MLGFKQLQQLQLGPAIAVYLTPHGRIQADNKGIYIPKTHALCHKGTGLVNVNM